MQKTLVGLASVAAAALLSLTPAQAQQTIKIGLIMSYTGQFADLGLLDEVIVWIASVTLGAGAPLLPRRLELRVEEQAWNGDFLCARYAVVGPLP